LAAAKKDDFEHIGPVRKLFHVVGNKPRVEQRYGQRIAKE
jgi:hypothetical protein